MDSSKTIPHEHWEHSIGIRDHGGALVQLKLYSEIEVLRT